jgi:hypothetical protein
MKIRFNKKELFNMYKDNTNLKKADIFHIYDTGKKCGKAGFRDSKFFKLVIFNTKTMEKRDCGNYHDGIRFSKICTTRLKLLRVFIDGSFLVRFQHPVTVDVFQEIFIVD